MADTMTLEQVRDWHCRFAETHNEDDTNTFHTKMADAIDAAIKQREQDKRDAARYRWLLKTQNTDCEYHSLENLAWYALHNLSGEETSNAIDAAMAKESGQ